MKKLLLCAIGAALFATPAMARDVWVNGYFRADGTYVPGYWRTAPDSNPYNNYSTTPNINPYTGERGTAQPVVPFRYKPYIPNPYSPPRYLPPVYTPPPAYQPYVYTPPCYYDCD